MWTPQDRRLVGDYCAGQALRDDRYRLIEPLLPAAKPDGRPRSTNMRRLLDVLFYVVRTGCQWRHLPPSPAFPPWPTVYRYFRSFLEAGVWESLRHHLVVMLREQEGRDPTLSAAIIDTQSVKTTEKGASEALTWPRKSRAASVTSRSIPRASCSASSSTPPASRTPTAPERC
ncbi:transposase (plasmid) [Azospirillum argentinense]|uniref:Transposase n=1 Tax=Azospirillum brasilense TaxID=192 RepID=A0A4D8Q0U0_AZOBR|nr:transposase [Azospirillum argentinense]